MKNKIEKGFSFLKKLENKKALWFLMGSIFLLIFIMCYYTFPTPDDFNYAHIPWTDIPLKSLGDVWRSQVSIYNEWSGRVIIMGLSQIFLMIHPLFFVIVNAGIFVGLIYCMSRFTKKKGEVKKVLFLFLCVWFCIPSFAENFIWLSGSFSYLWACFFVIVGVLLFYRKYILEKDVKYSFLIPVFLFLGAASHENAAFLLGSFLGCYVLFHFKQFWKLLKRKDILMIVNIIAFVLGFALLILAPGNFSRAEGSSFSPSITLILQNVMHVKKLIFALLLGILLLLFKKEYKKVKHILIHFIFPALISLSPMLFIKEFPLRSLLPFCLFLIIALFFCFSYFLSKYEKTATTCLLLFSVCLLPSVVKVSNYYLTVARTYKEDVEFAVKYNKNAGNKEWVIDTIGIDNSFPSKYILSPEFRPTSFANSIANIYFCRNYGCMQVVSKKEGYALIQIKFKEGSDFDYAYHLIVDGAHIVAVPLFATHPGTEKENENVLTFEIPERASQIEWVIPADHTATIDTIKIYRNGKIKELTEDSLYAAYGKEEKIEKNSDFTFKTDQEEGKVFLKEEVLLG